MGNRRLFALVLLAATAISARANLLVNGGFEASTLPAANWALFDSVPGWKATVGHLEIGKGSIYGTTGYEGANVLELDADLNSTVVQSLALSRGAYRLSFGYAQRARTAAATNAFDVLWNGTVVASVTPTSTSFATKSLHLTALAGTNVLAFRATGTSDGVGGIVDRVSLEAVPEPATVGALAVGAMGLLRRRRRG